MNQLTKLLGTLFVLSAVPAFAIKVSIKGDLNNRVNFYTNQANLYSTSETIGTIASPGTPINPDESVGESWADIKYRLGVEAETDDKLVKGVYHMEIGAIRFGFNVAGPSSTPPNAPNVPASTGRNSGGNFSGDGVNVETRFAYVDFGMPDTVPGKIRVTFGLQPTNVNRFLWNETATGIKLKGTAGPASITASWVRGIEFFNTLHRQPLFADADNFLLRGDVEPMKDIKGGIFALYQRRNPNVATPPAANSVAHLLKNFGPVTYNIVNAGVDATVKYGPFFGGLDFIYQGGRVTRIFATPRQDMSSFFAHLDLGANYGPYKVTYTGWYASGDDDSTDDDIKNFVATDVDTFESVVLFEGGYTDDNYFTEAPYFLNKGAILNRLGFEFKPTPKLNLGIAGLYILTAEDLSINDGTGTSKNLGVEFDASITYKLNDNMELAVNAGYLLSGDGIDAFEANQNGEADADIFRTTARARYSF
jgi:hypothetical protein